MKFLTGVGTLCLQRLSRKRERDGRKVAELRAELHKVSVPIQVVVRRSAPSSPPDGNITPYGAMTNSGLKIGRDKASLVRDVVCCPRGYSSPQAGQVATFHKGNCDLRSDKSVTGVAPSAVTQAAKYRPLLSARTGIPVRLRCPSSSRPSGP